MSPWLFLYTGWWCFMPMACLGGLAGVSSLHPLEVIKPGTMFLIEGDGEHHRYEVGEYNRAVL